jgi:hypothetical protein
MTIQAINQELASLLGLSKEDNEIDFYVNPALVLFKMDDRPEGLQGFLDFCCGNYLSEFGYISVDYILDDTGSLARAAINYLKKGVE